jgi:hypothetical protein
MNRGREKQNEIEKAGYNDRVKEKATKIGYTVQ